MRRAAQRVEKRITETRVLGLFEIVSPDMKPFVYSSIFNGCAVDALAKILRYASLIQSHAKEANKFEFKIIHIKHVNR